MKSIAFVILLWSVLFVVKITAQKNNLLSSQNTLLILQLPQQMKDSIHLRPYM